MRACGLMNVSVVPDERFLSEVAHRLEKWFAEHGRRYPWRALREPFLILVVELLLQRTRASMVERAFHYILEHYNDPHRLASASTTELNAVFSELGLLYRAERLKTIAEVLVEKYGGRVPNAIEELLQLKGVGVYIASAVMNFGYDVPTPVVDKNVMRVFNRLLGLTSEIQVRETIYRLYSFGDHVTLAYALIDLGAMICTASPKCRDCPLRDICNKNPLRKERWRMLRKVVIGGKVRLREQPVK